MAYRTINLEGDIFRHQELPADAAISPGMLVEPTATGVKKHGTEGAWHDRAVACEDALRGRTVATAYDTGDQVMIAFFTPGAKFAGLLKPGVSYAKGALLMSDGLGMLKAVASPTSGVTVQQPVARLMEACDLSASGAVATLAMCRML